MAVSEAQTKKPLKLSTLVAIPEYFQGQDT